jgi:hypothetical protein
MPRMSSVSPAHRCFALATLTFALLAAPPAPAAMYRWVDDTGAVVYSQSPPPDGRAASTVTPAAPPPSSAEAPRPPPRGPARNAADSNKSQASERQQQGSAAKEADRKRNCAAARQNLELIQNRPPQTRFQMPNGEYRRFTDEEREAEIKKARDFVDKNCR